MAAGPQWILYVDRLRKRPSQYDVGSRVCMEIVEHLQLHDAVAIQDCSRLRERGIEIPAQVSGTPSLVHRTALTVASGTEAVVQLVRGLGTPAAAPPAHVTAAMHAATRPEAPPVNVPNVAAPRRNNSERPLPHPTRPTEQPRTPETPFGAGGNARSSAAEGNDDDGDDMLGGGFGNLVDNPPTDDGLDQSRITEADVERLLNQRKSFDRQLQNGGGGGPP